MKKKHTKPYKTTQNLKPKKKTYVRTGTIRRTFVLHRHRESQQDGRGGLRAAEFAATETAARLKHGI